MNDLAKEADHAAVEVGVVDESLPYRKGSSDSPVHDHPTVRAPMRAVLMGRTMAGKSTLLAALTGTHHSRIGDGRQRFSRDIFGAISTVSTDIEVVDTPGVGAYGGADDTDAALGAALEADVVLWVNSSDSIQRESAETLKLLGILGKPIIIVLNCRQSLEGVGRINLLRVPGRVFGQKEGLLDEIRRHMAKAGVQPLDIVHVHALAAAEALTKPGGDADLHRASRIDELKAVLLREHDAHGEIRRAIRTVDTHRQQAEAMRHSLALGAATVQARAELHRGMAKDLHQRLDRILRATGEVMRSEVEVAVGRQRAWHLTVTDFGNGLQTEWATLISTLQEELDTALEQRLATLAAEMQSAVQEADSEWSGVSPEEFHLQGLSGFDSVWGHRLLRIGVGVGTALAGFAGGAAIGAKIGVLAGLAGGPALTALTLTVGGIAGGAIGLAITPIKNLIDHMALGKDGVLRKRREQVSKLVGPILDDVTEQYQRALDTKFGDLRRVLTSNHLLSEGRSTRLDHLAATWTTCQEELGSLIEELDGATTSALLNITGRRRLAGSVTRATRVPGVCIFVEFEGSAFWESWFFPPDLGEVLAAGKPSAASGDTLGSLTYALGLADTPVHITGADGVSTRLTIDADIPSTITDTWADGLTNHLGGLVQIQTARKARHQ